MNQKRIRQVFNKVFNNLPNPIFCYPMFYFQQGNFLCEVAEANKNTLGMKWNNREYGYMSPLLILEGLFVDDGMYITVLERKDNAYIHRTDLCKHICNKSEIHSFVKSLE